MTWLLEPGAGPSPEDLSQRAAFWVERFAAFARLEPELEQERDRRRRPRAAHARAESLLPLSSLQGDLSFLLRAWFGDALDALKVDLSASSLGRARSWLDLSESTGSDRPAALIEACASAEAAHALLFRLFCDPRLGCGLGRYAERVEVLVRHAEERWAGAELRAWDAGCALGEGTWELAAALGRAGLPARVLGTTPWPLELLMARARWIPGDPSRSRALERVALEARGLGAAACFGLGDLRSSRPSPPSNRQGQLSGSQPGDGSCHLVLCHGVLGESLPASAAILERLVAALAPGGILSLTDRFREDRRSVVEGALAKFASAGPLAGCEVLGPGVYAVPTRT